jgi:hypothetical protein
MLEVQNRLYGATGAFSLCCRVLSLHVEACETPPVLFEHLLPIGTMPCIAMHES